MLCRYVAIQLLTGAAVVLALAELMWPPARIPDSGAHRPQGEPFVPLLELEARADEEREAVEEAERVVRSGR